jgi:hypothetical protein
MRSFPVKRPGSTATPDHDQSSITENKLSTLDLSPYLSKNITSWSNAPRHLYLPLGVIGSDLAKDMKRFHGCNLHRRSQSNFLDHSQLSPLSKSTLAL